MKDSPILRRVSEFNTLGNRLKRYWGRLLLEAMKIAKERGIQSEFVDLNNPDESVLIPEGSNIIPIYREEGGCDDSILLKLAKPKFSSLYRRFMQGNKRHGEIESELRGILERRDSS